MNNCVLAAPVPWHDAMALAITVKGVEVVQPWLLVVTKVPEVAPEGTITLMTVGETCVTTADIPFMVAVAPFRLLLVAVTVTSVPTGPDAGASTFVAELQAPLP